MQMACVMLSRGASIVDSVQAGATSINSLQSCLGGMSFAAFALSGVLYRQGRGLCISATLTQHSRFRLHSFIRQP